MERIRSRARTRRRSLRERVSTLEADLAETNRRLSRFEGVLRETDGVSIAGPCRCGEGLLVVRGGTIRYPACRYRRTI